MRGTIETICDAETNLLRVLQKAVKGKKVNTIVCLSIRRSRRAKESPEWQNTAVQTVKDAYDEKEGKVDDAKIGQLLVENGLNTDKRVMPFT
jgi:hypothetical protein